MQELDEVKKILDDEEEVRLAIKPNKKRATVVNILSVGIILNLIAIVFIIVGILGLAGVISFANENEQNVYAPPITLLAMGLLFLIPSITTVIGFFRRYKNTIYVVTNKRLIIRSGYVGVDYKSLFISSITMMNVRVDALDKLVNPNTGSIIFASSATPVSTQEKNQKEGFVFNYIDEPYETYKKIKELIDEK